jgi:glycosyltransferase involved in cell wall biosynthesis
MAASVFGPETATEDRMDGRGIAVTLLTGGFDKPYAYGLATALMTQHVVLDVIGSEDVDSPEFHGTPLVSFLRFWNDQRSGSGVCAKIARVVVYYARLLRYTAVAQPKIFHILWNNKVQLFDRTLLMFYYKACGKRLVLTAHNVNAGKRDGNDSLLNRLSLRVQYRLCDHLFVHSDKMKAELIEDFGVRGEAVTVIPFGINNSVPDTELTRAQARKRLGIERGDKAILFFGGIRPYKGLEYLVDAFQRMEPEQQRYRLIIAGQVKKGYEDYLSRVQETIRKGAGNQLVVAKYDYIPDEDTEVYFKAADVLALPYTYVFQSGVLFLAYSFGVPVVATEVGSVGEEIIVGRTGFLCRPCDAADLSGALKRFFASDLLLDADRRRSEIRDHARRSHSWQIIGEMTHRVYKSLSGAEVS